MATLITALVDFLISFSILILIMIYYPFCAGMAHLAVALFYRDGVAGQPGTKSLDYRPECKIPRFSLCYPICRAVWSLYFSGGLHQQGDSGTVATDLQSQSHGGRD